MTDSLLSKKKNLSNFVIEECESDRLFYGKYAYSVEVFCSCISYYRNYKTVKHVRDLLEPARRGFIRRNPWQLGAGNEPRADLLKKIEEAEQVAEFLFNNRDHIKTSISYDSMFLYTNDLGLVDELLGLDGVISYRRSVRKATITRPFNTIKLQKSDYKYRTYFKSMFVGDELKHKIAQYLISYSAEIKMSPALKTFCYAKGQDKYSFLYLENYYFIDHNNKSVLTMLSLISNNIFRNTYEIITVNSTEEQKHGESN